MSTANNMADQYAARVTDISALNKLLSISMAGGENLSLMSRTYDGNVIYAGAALGGTLSFYNLNSIDSFSAPNLTAMSGFLDIAQCDTIASISLPLLVTANGTPTGITINNNLALATINLASLTSVSGNLDINYNPDLTSLNLNALTGVTLGINLDSNSSLIALSLTALTSAGTIYLRYATDLTSFTAPNLSSLTTAQGLLVEWCGSLASLSLPAITSCYSVSIQNNLSLTTLSLAALGTITSDIVISGNPLTSLNLSAITAASINITVSGTDLGAHTSNLVSVSPTKTVNFNANTSLVSLVFNSLTSCNGTILCYGSSALTGAPMHSLATIGNGTNVALIDLHNNTALEASVISPDILVLTTIEVNGKLNYSGCTNTMFNDLNFTTLTTMKGELDCSGCTYLDAVYVPVNITIADGFVWNMANCALLVGSVDAHLAALAAGIGATVSGTVNLSG
jgi:hypothetical protein